MRIKPSVTSANLIALLALFVAIGGSAYAFPLGKNAVKTKNIKNGAVTTPKLAPGAVTSDKLAPDAVTSKSLGPIVVRTAQMPLNDGSDAVPEARCQPGERSTGGGGLTALSGSGIQFEALRPLQINGTSAQDGDTPGAWSAVFENPIGGGGSTVAFAYAICIK
jgi:hypothetical protein